MEGDGVCFCVVFIDLERHKSFAYIPKRGSKSCSSPQKFIWWAVLILEFLKMDF